MAFTWSFKKQFAAEFERFPEDQQNKVLDFLDIFEAKGLSNFSDYPGKITPSWSGIDPNDPLYNFTKYNNLWHYHVGLPTYTQRHPQYKTSDWVLHFQWARGSTHIALVDMYQHYLANGEFYLPPAYYLADEEPPQ